MLKIYRKYAAYIAIGIVVFFVGTMFTGAVLFGQFDPGNTSETRNVDVNNVVAYNQSIEVPFAIFNEMFQRLATQVPESVLKFNPEILEQLSFSAFQRAVEYQQILAFASDKKIKVSRAEYKSQLATTLKSFDVASESELKKDLKERGVDYSLFKAYAKNNIKVQKAYQSIINSVVVTDLDLNWSTQTIGVTQYSLPLTSTENIKKEDLVDAVKSQMEAVYLALQSGTDINLILKDYKDLKVRELNSVKWGQLDLRSEKIVFDLSMDEYSEPIALADRVTVYKLTSRVSGAQVLGDNEAEKAKLLGSKQQRALSESLADYGTWQSITVSDKRLEPIIQKRLGQVTRAIDGYKSLVSQSPSNPVPYYLLGNFQEQLGLDKEALETWEKGVILADVSPEIKLPILYLKLGSMYKDQKQYKKMNQSFNKAVDIVFEDIQLAEQTSSYFKSINESQRVAKLDKQIKALKDEKEDQKRRLKEANESDEGLIPESETEELLQLN